MVRIAAGLSTRLYMPAAIVLLATGIWMVLIEDVYGRHTFVTIGFAMIVVGTLLGIFVFERSSVRQRMPSMPVIKPERKRSGDGWPGSGSSTPFSCCSRSRPWCSVSEPDPGSPRHSEPARQPLHSPVC